MQYRRVNATPLLLPFVPVPTIADDYSRVVLSEPNSDGSDYINASFIDVSSCEIHMSLY